MPTTKPELTAVRLRELLDYDLATGIFRWRVGRRGASLGAQAGHIDVSHPRNGGYRCIRIDGRGYRSSRLAWLWMMGRWPDGEIDHENLKRDDDRWDNLRGANSRRFTAMELYSAKVVARVVGKLARGSQGSDRLLQLRCMSPQLALCHETAIRIVNRAQQRYPELVTLIGGEIGIHLPRGRSTT